MGSGVLKDSGPKLQTKESLARRTRPEWSWRGRVMLAILVAFFVGSRWGLDRTGFSPSTVVDGVADMQRLAARMWPLNFGELDLILRLSLETLFIAFIGTALAVAISIPLAFLAARNTSPGWFAGRVATGFIVVTRAIPDLIFAMIFVRAIGIGGTRSITAGVLAIGISAVGMVGKLYADAIESVDEGPRDAIASTGAGRVQTLITGVIPQVSPSFIGVALYRFDINFRSSTILGYVGAGGIGSLLREYLSGLRYERALAVAVVIVVLVLVVEFLSGAIRRQILGSDPFSGRGVAGRIRSWAAPRFSGMRSESVADGPRPANDAAMGEARGAASSATGSRLSPPWTGERLRLAAFGWGSLLFLVWSFSAAGLTPFDLVRHARTIAAMMTRLVPTDLSWLTPAVIDGMIESLAIGFAATVLGVGISLPLAFFAAYNVAPARSIYRATRALLVGIRALPDLIIAVLFVSAVGLGPFPGVLALTIGMTGFATKLYADAIEEVMEGPREATRSVGASRLQEVFTAVIPQAMPALVSITLYIFDIIIRASTILGIIGAGGIGFALLEATRTLRWDTVGGIMIVIFLMVYAVERLSGWLRKQLI